MPVSDNETATILSNRAQLETMVCLYDEANDDIDVAIKIYNNLPIYEQYNIVDVKCLKALVQMYSMDEAYVTSWPEKEANTIIEIFDDVANYCRKWYGEKSRKYGWALGNLGYAYMMSRDYDSAEEYFNQELEIYKNTGDDYYVELTEGYLEIVDGLRDGDTIVVVPQEELEGYKK